MVQHIRVGIVGYGNLGRGAEMAIKKTSDMELIGVFTRREPKAIQTIEADTKVYHMDEMNNFQDKIDVMILCGGSADDLPILSPEIVKQFNIVDSFDNHSQILEHLNRVQAKAQASGKIGIISVGWDPGLFSMNRLLGYNIFTLGETYTFRGEGLSHGHLDAVRIVNGVKNAVQYTVPIETELNTAITGHASAPNASKRHKCVCSVEADTHDEERIEQE